MRNSKTVKTTIVILIMITTAFLNCTRTDRTDAQATSTFFEEDIQNVQQINIEEQRSLSSERSHLETDIIGQTKLQLPTDLEFLEARTAGNLSIVYIRGNTTLEHKSYFTLQEALKLDMLEVIETSTVSELQASNRSDKYIYINSGDIVRGGKQDRTIAFDIIIPPKAKKVDLASFCVESGRWNQRGKETAASFETSANSLSSRDLKIAAKKSKNQSKVWSEVEETQSTLDENMSAYFGVTGSVRSPQSASSLELTLEDASLDSLRMINAEKLHMTNSIENDLIGFAYFINGELYGIDIFNNKALFADLQEKLINSAITEAITLYSDKEHPAIDDISLNDILRSQMDILEKAELNASTLFITMNQHDAPNTHVFQCTDRQENNWLHYNVIQIANS